MTTVYLLLGLGFVLPLGSIGTDMLREMIRDAAGIRTDRDIARLTAPLPPERESLLPEDFHHTWPQRQTPSDLPPRVGLVVAVDRPRPGRHRAPDLDALETPTGQFWLIVDNLGDLEEPCSHCAAPEDGEPAHSGCPGCCCPCTLATAVA